MLRRRTKIYRLERTLQRACPVEVGEARAARSGSHRRRSARGDGGNQVAVKESWRRWWRAGNGGWWVIRYTHFAWCIFSAGSHTLVFAPPALIPCSFPYGINPRRGEEFFGSGFRNRKQQGRGFRVSGRCTRCRNSLSSLKIGMTRSVHWAYLSTHTHACVCAYLRHK